MKKMWNQNDFRKLFQFANDEKEHKKTLIQLINNSENNEFVIDEIKQSFYEDYPDFLDTLSETYHDLEDNVKSQLIPWVLEHSEFHDESSLYRELDAYQFFKTTVMNLSDYMNTMTSLQALNNIQNEEEVEKTTQYFISKYYYQNKANKADYIYQKTQCGKQLRQIVNDYYAHDINHLLTFAEENYQADIHQQQMILDKKVEKLVNKARKKLTRLLNEQIDLSLLCDELQQLKSETFQKIDAYIGKDYENYPSVFTLYSDMNAHIDHFQDLITHKEEQKEEPIEEHEEKITVNDNDLKVIEDFYRNHHLYYKKSQIILELTEYPFVMDFYHFYNQIQLSDDKEKNISQLEELASDIRESGLKDKEILRRLLSVAHKQIDDYIDEEQTENYVEEEISLPSEHSDEVIKIGKFMVLKDSVQDNPVDFQKIIHLLAPEDHHEINWFKSLIYQIGYDKVNAYLLKSPGMSIYDLQVIIQLDRSLRFEYQHILEDIEMYFRSTFTYFLSNKYDQKYLMVENLQPFYKRGYLMGNLFSEYQEHYEQVKLLRERIDDEMKNNNIQVIEEYKRYKYALPFSTAAGIMTFGWIINLFENLNYYDKSEYLRHYYQRLTPQTFYCWMVSLSNLRNRCAHYQSLYRLSSLKELRPIMTKEVDGNGYDDDIKHSSLFYYTLIMSRLSPNVSHIEDFIDNVGILVRKVNRESLSFDFQKDYSFPKNWRTVLENEKSVKMNFNDELL